MNSLKDSDFMVFSGTANLPLAEKVASYLGKPLNKIDIKHFPDGETFCQVQEGVRGRDVFVIQSGSPAPNEAYMELFIIMDALKRGSAARITAVIPYYGYARQDRKDQPRVPITARLVANLITAAGADRVYVPVSHRADRGFKRGSDLRHKALGRIFSACGNGEQLLPFRLIHGRACADMQFIRIRGGFDPEFRRQLAGQRFDHARHFLGQKQKMDRIFFGKRLEHGDGFRLF